VAPRIPRILVVGLFVVAAASCSANAPAETDTAGTAANDTVPLTTAAPAGTDAGTSIANTSADPRAQGVKFSECMRDNGVKGFPDPDPSGQLTIDGVLNGSSLDPNSAAWKKATAACSDLEPPGFTGHKRTAKEQEGALKFAQCMRDNGVKDFPDPAPDAPLIDTGQIPSMADKDPRTDAGLTGAMAKCRDLAAAAGVTAGP
jgi:hypothetical protein